MNINRLIVLLAFVACALPALTQERAKEERNANVYKLDFTVYELENGKRVNDRSYTLHATDADRRGASTRVGTRVPISSGDKGVQYIDVGLRIETNIQSSDGSGINLYVSFESSGFAVPEQGQNPQAGTPVLRNVNENVTAHVALNKPTLISSVDDVNSKRRLQLEVSATKVK